MASKHDSVIAPFSAILMADPPTADPALKALFALAFQALEQERYVAAQTLYDEIIWHDRANEAGFVGLAIAHYCTNRPAVAERYAVQAQTLNQLLGGHSRSQAYVTLLAQLTAAPAPAIISDDPAANWWTALVRHHPTRQRLDKDDPIAETAAFDEFFLAGFSPPHPVIGPEAEIATIGSCFATNIAKYLHETGRKRNKTQDAYENLFVEDEFFNTFVMREAFEIAFAQHHGGRNWIDGAAEKAAPRAIRFHRDRIRMLLGAADAYIITLGLSEIWYDKSDGTIFPSGLSIEEFDADRHGFRVSTPEENLANLARIIDLIRTHRGDVPVVVTLSPVPLQATFRPINCVGANTVSKAVLRIAIDLLMSERAADKQLFYFPSYEIVTSYFRDPFDGDLRHLKVGVVDFVMQAFDRTFLAKMSPGLAKVS